MSIPRLCVVFLCTLALFGLGCGTPAPKQAAGLPDQAQDSLITLLANLDRTLLRRAFAQLPEYTYRRTRQTAYFEAADDPAAVQTRTILFAGSPQARTLEITAENSSGALPDGFSLDAAQEDTTALGAYMLPEEPTYLTPRGREGYRFSRLPDSTLFGQAVQVLNVEALPGARTKLRQARLYVEPGSQALVGLDVHRTDVSLMFGEQSHFRLFLQPGPRAAWLPAQTLVDTQIKAFLSAPKRFRTRTLYTFTRPAGQP